ncbi:YbaK/EbsC family protein [Ornithinimicrobium humiphilum]|uniref:Prolyl-tRNA editing enzyme YbaK/EbsC (Cys-tRNA(Pro) deacylase) n=1 Tax=Ornithinimicrobium humiphilum TaxID=125288 RepID=A0A543K6F4_9MICO|nr:YbaK/EbsC family protein [Ornithinimicrobium humiphilum]TQM90663.1 prolyl-tRNA editing enzyme YbaK/EbsC (Cys-tRNA(Pro) deacylase) [Ornithinimicrobium humiphilum]
MHPRNVEVQDALHRAGIDSSIVVLDSHARTAVLAAEQLGCEVAAIANSLVFLADDEPLLVMASGAARVDTDVIARAVGATAVRKADADQVRAATGQAIGGVAPTGHPAPLRTLVDEDLRAHDEVWAAGGTPDTVFPLTFDQLVALTGGTVTAVR